MNIDELGHAVDREWEAVAGTVRIAVEPDHERAADHTPPSPWATASVTLENVRLEATDDGAPAQLDRLELAGATVGCGDAGHIC